MHDDTASTRAQDEALRPGRMCQCSQCGELFGSPSAFDRHQEWNDEGTRYVCTPSDAFTVPRGKAGKPLLVRHPRRGVWVTSLRSVS